MADLKNGYSEKILGVSCVVEKLHSGFYRVVTEDGRDDQVRSVNGKQLHVGDVGRTVYYGYGNSYGLVRFDVDSAMEFDFERAKRNYPYGWKDNWPSCFSKDAEALFEIFKQRYIDAGYMYSGMIPLNAATICAYEVKDLYELVNAGVLQKRDCDGDVFELTVQERAKLINKYNLQDVWIKSGQVDLCEDEITKVLNNVPLVSLADKLADAQEKSAHGTGKDSINLDEYEYVSNVDGYSTFRKIVTDEDGYTKGIWAARHQDGGEAFAITYGQARGFEPIIDTPIKRLARELGELLLP